MYVEERDSVVYLIDINVITHTDLFQPMLAKFCQSR